MTRTGTWVRRTALVLTALFAVGGLLFALGYAFEDPGGWPAVLLATALLAPLVTLVVVAARQRDLAVRLLTGGVVLFAAWGALGLVVRLVDAPDVPVVALVLALPIAVVGQRRPLRAAVLLLATAAVPLLLVVVRLVGESRTMGPVQGPVEGPVEGPGVGALLGTSTGVVVVPLVVLGTMFLGAAALDRTSPRAAHPRRGTSHGRPG